MATVTVSIGSNQSIDTETTASCSGSNPYVTTFGTTPSGIAVGDLATASDAFANVYVYLVTAIDGDDITLKYISGGMSAASPCSLGSFGGGASVTFKRYYSTITLWEAGLDATALYSSSDDAVGECYNDSVFGESVALNGGGTVGLASVTLSVASGERHDGTAGTGARMLTTLSGTTSCIDIAVGGFAYNIVGLELSQTGSLSNTFTKGVGFAQDDDASIRQCLIHAIGGATKSSRPAYGIGSGGSRSIVQILNNIVYDIGGFSGDIAGGYGIYNSGRDASVTYNNTVFNCHDVSTLGGVGIKMDSDTTIKNCISMDNANGDFTDTGDGSTDYNLSSDSSATGSNSLVSKTSSDQFVSTSGGSEDLHLKDDADALRAGADLGTSPAGVNIDIDYRDRDSEGDDWDIGADRCEGCSEAGAATANPAFLMFVDT